VSIEEVFNGILLIVKLLMKIIKKPRNCLNASTLGKAKVFG